MLRPATCRRIVASLTVPDETLTSSTTSEPQTSHQRGFGNRRAPHERHSPTTRAVMGLPGRRHWRWSQSGTCPLRLVHLERHRLTQGAHATMLRHTTAATARAAPRPRLDVRGGSGSPGRESRTIPEGSSPLRRRGLRSPRWFARDLCPRKWASRNRQRGRRPQFVYGSPVPSISISATSAVTPVSGRDLPGPMRPTQHPVTPLPQSLGDGAHP
jgi:hypothetical protein